MKHVLYFTKKIHDFSGKLLYINLIGMVFISLFESVGILLVIPLLNLVGIKMNDSKGTSLISDISVFFQSFSELESLLIILGIYVFIIISQSYIQKKQMILNVKIQQGFIRLLRTQAYTSIIEANWGFFLSKRKTDLINIMTTEVMRVSGGTNLFLQFLTSLVFTIIQIVIAFMLSPKMTLFILLFGLVLIYSSRRFISKSNTLGKSTVDLNKMYLAGITDNFNGIKDIKSNTLEKSYLKWFELLNEKIEQNIIELVKVKTTSQLLYKVVSAFLIAGFVFFSIKMLKAQPTELMLIIMIFSRLWPRFTGIQSNMEQLGSIIPSFQVLFELQNDAIREREIYSENLNLASPMLIKKGIECKNLSFRYNKLQFEYALQDINIKIPVNNMTAIVGRSGAGKSTLIDILMGLNQPELGQVLIDDVILSKENVLSLRQAVSYVAQDPFLFNETIRENLMIIDKNASEEQLWEALEFAAAADFVTNLPHGLDTLIGDRGVKLSGGERQRLVLARAILRKPSILILDEATSALDTENEAKIQEALDGLKGKMTIIVIAHRLSTIRNADQVIVLDHGRIIQTGGFRQLANEEDGMFHHLLGRQMEVTV